MTEQEKERKKKKNRLIMSIFLIVVMIGSTIGFGYNYYQNESSSQTTNKIKYNKFVFEFQNGFWMLSKDNNNFIFRYNPTETNSNEISLNKLEYYKDKIVYISSEDDFSESEIYVNLNQFTQRIQKACLTGEKCSEDLPVKTCYDDFIIIKESNLSEIKVQDKCIIIQGKTDELIKLSDEFLFKTIGIKNN